MSVRTFVHKPRGMAARIAAMSFGIALLSIPALAEMVLIASEPRGAEVFLEGREKKLGITPFATSLPEGKHTLRFKKKGYYDKVDTLLVGPHSRNSITAVLVERRTTISVSTTPPRCTVLIDGTEAGASPVRSYEVEPGEHAVRAEHPGYEPAETTVPVEEGQREKVRLSLKKSEDAPDEQAAGEAGEQGEPEEVPDFIEADCWVCRGQGYLTEMGCIQCGGKGYIGVTPCTGCGGTGRQEIVCPTCKGEGTVMQRGKKAECPTCKGTGKPVCPACEGSGKVKVPNPEAFKGRTNPCPACDATGRLIEKCALCGGTGEMRVSERRSAHSSDRRYTTVPCYYCKGAGKAPPQCKKCQGTGIYNNEMCPRCYGTGQEFIPCPLCRGRRWIPAGRR